MSTKKKVSSKQPVALHAIGAKVYIINHQGREEAILQAEVMGSEVKRVPITAPESGKITGVDYIVSYDLKTVYGPFVRYEVEIYKAFPDVAKVFAHQYLQLLK